MKLEFCVLVGLALFSYLDFVTIAREIGPSAKGHNLSYRIKAGRKVVAPVVPKNESKVLVANNSPCAGVPT